MAIKIGDTVTVQYTGRIANGDIFDSSHNNTQPLKIVVGEDKHIKGFEYSLKGREKGDKYIVTIPAEEGYGEHYEDLIIQVHKSTLPKDVTPEVGMIFQVETDNGMMEAHIVDINEDIIVLDANHPFAGEELTFEIEVLDHY